MPPPTKQISLRIPTELLKTLDDLAEEQKRTRTELIISLLQDGLGDVVSQLESQASEQDLCHLGMQLISQSAPFLSSFFSSFLRYQSTSQAASQIPGTLTSLTDAIQALAEGLSRFNVAPGGRRAEVPEVEVSSTKEERSKGRKKVKTTKKGGKPAPLYLYDGKEATLREHLQAALPQLDKGQLNKARNNINRKIKGRTDKKAAETRPPAEAIEHEIRRWQKVLGLES